MVIKFRPSARTPGNLLNTFNKNTGNNRSLIEKSVVDDSLSKQIKVYNSYRLFD